MRGNIGTFHYPGPGFLPFWSAVGLGVLSILLVVKSSLTRGGVGEIGDDWKGKKWRNGIWLIISLFIYAILLPRLGYIITTFGLMTYHFGLVGKTKLWIQVLGGLIVALLTYIIFGVWLQLQLPAGVFSF
jgi:hypothetical protein